MPRAAVADGTALLLKAEPEALRLAVCCSVNFRCNYWTWLIFEMMFYGRYLRQGWTTASSMDEWRSLRQNFRCQFRIQDMQPGMILEAAV